MSKYGSFLFHLDFILNFVLTINSVNFLDSSNFSFLDSNRDRTVSNLNSEMQPDRIDTDLFGSNEFTNFATYDSSNYSLRPDVHGCETLVPTSTSTSDKFFDFSQFKEEIQTSATSKKATENNERSRIAQFFPKVQSNTNFLSPSPDLKAVKSEGNFANLLGQECLDSSRSASGSPKRQAFEFLQKSFLGSTSNSPRKLPEGQKLNSKENVGEKDKEDYLYHAAQFISSAQRSEAEGHYDLAFSCYKAGVNLLLRGVQGEQDVGRRNAVRRKTAKYLMRAERIFCAFLSGGDEKTAPTKKTALWSEEEISISIQDPAAVGLRGKISDLMTLKLKEMIKNGVYFVNDSTNGKNFLIKSLKKSNFTIKKNWLSIVPVNLPNMVKLIRFVETQSAIYLQLQYCCQGLLWNHLKKFFATKKNQIFSFQISKIQNETKKVENNEKSRKAVVFSVSDYSEPDPNDNEDEFGEFTSALESSDASIFTEYLEKAAKVSKKDSFGSYDETLRSSVDDSHLNVSVDPKFTASDPTAQGYPTAAGYLAVADDSVAQDYLTTVGDPKFAADRQISPNPELKFQAVFDRLKTSSEQFSIDEAESGSGKNLGTDGSVLKLIHKWLTDVIVDRKNLPLEFVRFWTAQMILAVSHLHKEGIFLL